MGALHDGHLALVARARRLADRTVVSLFVNPAQFGPHEDFAKYPARRGRRPRHAAPAGVDLLFAPAVAEIYPPGFATMVSVGGLGDALDGMHRPGHFAGVATVVAKLLIAAQADLACFGDKDYQQLQIVKRLAADLGIPTRSSACRRCASATASRCRRATPISPPTSARWRRPCTGCCSTSASASKTA